MIQIIRKVISPSSLYNTLQEFAFWHSVHFQLDNATEYVVCSTESNASYNASNNATKN